MKNNFVALAVLGLSSLALDGCQGDGEEAPTSDSGPGATTAGGTSGDGDGDTMVGDGDGDGDAITTGCTFDPGPEVVTVPDLGPRALILDPTMDTAAMQAQLDQLAAQQEPRESEFGPNRYAVLFKPGTYNLDVYAGYYMQIAGLGLSPGDVVINGGVESRQVGGTALSMFWRGAENLTVVPSDGTNSWAASQASPLRRMHIVGNLTLSEGGYTSGGFLADSRVDGTVSSGTQQQYFNRNVLWNQWAGGVWNMFFLGVINPPAGAWPDSPYTTIAQTPSVREKPFLYIDAEGAYQVFVPSLREDSVGPSWDPGPVPGESVPINSFYVAHEDTDTAATLNAALSECKHLLFTPGKYELEAPIAVTNPGTIVLGIGYATLMPTAGTPAMTVADVGNVSLAGITFDAGPVSSTTLLEVGPSGSSADHSAAPTLLSDLFCRVGSLQEGTASSCVTINSHDVLADHFWLWRADHGPSATEGRPGWGVNVSPNGLLVNGDDVTIYGLFNEHFQGYQTLWSGERGRTYFYQCEMPYDASTQDVWSDNGGNGYTAYKVADGVTEHEAWGLGAYTTFQAGTVYADNTFEVPDAPGVVMHNLFSRYLSAAGGIYNVINGVGGPALEGGAPQASVVYYNNGDWY